jgi:hypothetical protein
VLPSTLEFGHEDDKFCKAKPHRTDEPCIVFLCQSIISLTETKLVTLFFVLSIFFVSAYDQKPDQQGPSNLDVMEGDSTVEDFYPEEEDNLYEEDEDAEEDANRRLGGYSCGYSRGYGGGGFSYWQGGHHHLSPPTTVVYTHLRVVNRRHYNYYRGGKAMSRS